MARLEEVLSGWEAVRWCEENPGKELVCAEPHTFGPARMRVSRTVDGAPSLVQVRSGGSPEWKDARSAIWWPWEVAAMTPSPSLPVRHVWETYHEPPCEKACYSKTPTPGLEWVVGHMNHCIQCQPFCGGECTCPHSTQTWVSVPSGAVEPMLITKDATLQYWGHGTWLPVQGAPEHAHYREAWEEIGPVWTDARKDEGEIVAPRDGLIFLCERMKPCPHEDATWDREGLVRCHHCSGTGTLRRWVLEWGSTWQGVPDWSDMAAVAKAMDDLGYAALLVFPSPESRDAGNLEEAGMVERRYLP